MSRISLQRPVVMAAIFGVVAAELYITWLAFHPNVDEGYRAYYIDQTTTCLDKPISAHYALGATVSFLPEDWRGAKALRVCGWDGPAGDGTHSVGTSSRLRFPIERPARTLTLRLYVTAVETSRHDQRIVVSSGNGLPLGEARIPAGESRTVEFPVPPEAVEPGEGLDIVITYPDAVEVMPRDSNTHFRSIKLVALQLRRPGDIPSSGPLDDPAARSYEPGPQNMLKID